MHKVKEIGRNMTYMELSTNPRYMDEFERLSFLIRTHRCSRRRKKRWQPTGSYYRKSSSIISALYIEETQSRLQ
ncbi:MAG: hypothetical protein V8S32_08680 [Lachnospiraceae bacterium]